MVWFDLDGNFIGTVIIAPKVDDAGATDANITAFNTDIDSHAPLFLGGAYSVDTEQDQAGAEDLVSMRMFGNRFGFYNLDQECAIVEFASFSAN